MRRCSGESTSNSLRSPEGPAADVRLPAPGRTGAPSPRQRPRSRPPIQRAHRPPRWRPRPDGRQPTCGPATSIGRTDKSAERSAKAGGSYPKPPLTDLTRPRPLLCHRDRPLGRHAALMQVQREEGRLGVVELNDGADDVGWGTARSTGASTRASGRGWPGPRRGRTDARWRCRVRCSSRPVRDARGRRRPCCHGLEQHHPHEAGLRLALVVALLQALQAGGPSDLVRALQRLPRERRQQRSDEPSSSGRSPWRMRYALARLKPPDSADCST